MKIRLRSIPQNVPLRAPVPVVPGLTPYPGAISFGLVVDSITYLSLILGPLHLFGIALIVVGVVVLNVAPDASRA